jgi:peptidoglycan/xylan/chitin deacetylase (PgdA/CDA1 family)
MVKKEIIYLMYHELELPDRCICNPESGYKRYVSTETNFRTQISRLSQLNYVGLNVSSACDPLYQDNNRIVITFDDGCETDLIVAASILSEFKFNATFYVVGGFVGQKGYLSINQLRELSDLGFEIGSHSMTHRYLTDLNKTHLHFEVSHSKDRLEQYIGKKVDHFSCPGGRWNPQVANIVKESGYESMATSRIGTNNPNLDHFLLSRIPVLRDIPLSEFEKICKAQGIIKLHLRNTVFSAAKGIFGNKMYEKIRNKVLEESPFYKL